MSQAYAGAGLCGTTAPCQCAWDEWLRSQIFSLRHYNQSSQDGALAAPGTEVALDESEANHPSAHCSPYSMWCNQPVQNTGKLARFKRLDQEQASASGIGFISYIQPG